MDSCVFKLDCEVNAFRRCRGGGSVSDSLLIFLYSLPQSLSAAPPRPSHPSSSACMTASLHNFILVLKSLYVSPALTASLVGVGRVRLLSQSHPDTWMNPCRTSGGGKKAPADVKLIHHLPLCLLCSAHSEDGTT